MGSLKNLYLYLYEDDQSLLDFVDNQSDINKAIKFIVKEYISNHGFDDVFNRAPYNVSDSNLEKFGLDLFGELDGLDTQPLEKVVKSTKKSNLDNKEEPLSNDYDNLEKNNESLSDKSTNLDTDNAETKGSNSEKDRSDNSSDDNNNSTNFNTPDVNVDELPDVLPEGFEI